MMVTLIGSKNRPAHRMCHERHLIIVIITNFVIVISPQKQGVSVFKLKKKRSFVLYHSDRNAAKSDKKALKVNNYIVLQKQSTTNSCHAFFEP